MKRIIVSIAFLLATPRSGAAVQCEVGTLASYLGAMPCEVGSLTFGGFSYSAGGTNPVLASMITVTPIFAPDDESGLSFSSLWRVHSREDTDSRIGYTITGEITDATLMMQSFAVLGAGNVRVTETAGNGLSLLVFKSSDLLKFSDSGRFGAVSSLMLTDEITLKGNDGGFAALHTVTNTFSTSEPAPYSLFALGLAGLAVLLLGKARSLPPQITG